MPIQTPRLMVILALAGLSLASVACSKDKEVAVNAPAGGLIPQPKLRGPAQSPPAALPPQVRLPVQTGLFVYDEGEVRELKEKGRPPLTGDLLVFILHDRGAPAYTNWSLRRQAAGDDSGTSYPLRVTPFTGRDDVVFVDAGTTLALGLHRISATSTTGTLERAFEVESLDMRDARYFVRENNPAEALRCMDDALKADPLNAEAFILRGSLMSRKGDAAALEQDARRIIEIAPDRPEGHGLLAQARLMQGDPAAALEAINRALEIAEQRGLDEQDANHYYFRARLRWAARDAEAALADAGRALDLVPGFPSCLSFRANILFGRGEFDAALADVNEAIKQNDSFVYALVLRSNLLRLRKRYKEALSDAEAVLAIEARHPAASAARALVLEKQGQRQQALGTLDEALAASPESEDLLLVKAWINRQAGEHETALTLYDRAAQVAPGSPYAWSGRIASLVALGRKDDALAAADKAASLSGSLSQINLADVLACRAEALSGAGRRDEALALLEEARTLSPSGEEVQRVAALLDPSFKN